MRNRTLSHCGKFRVCLLGVLVLGANTHAATATTRENPYAKTIVGRNVFHLNIAPGETIVVRPPPAPPRIILQGLTSILGRSQVLFKVQTPPKPGEPPAAMSWVLSERERLGEIEVLEIDVKGGTAKFNNHGVKQTLSLKDNGEHPRQ